MTVEELLSVQTDNNKLRSLQLELARHEDFNPYKSQVISDMPKGSGYKNFIETLYGYTELTKSTLQYEEILKMPYPVFYDYLNFVISQKKAEAAKQQRQINEMKK